MHWGNNRKEQYFSWLVLLLLIPCFLLFCIFLLPPKYTDTYLGELGEKYELLLHTEEKKLVIVGGSSVAFGVDCDMLAKELGEYTPVNFGLYGGLGTKVMLDLAKDKIGTGDLVIIMPEQSKQTLSCNFDGRYGWQAFDGHLGLIWKLQEKEQKELWNHMVPFAWNKFLYTINRTKPELNDIYQKKSFDQYGSIDKTLLNYNQMAEQYDPTTLITFDDTMPNEEFFTYVNEFTKEVEQNGATVWYHLCPMNSLAVQNADQIEAYFHWLSTKLVCDVIGDPNKSILDQSLFYDTNFHLNGEGQALYTYQLIRDIKAMLGDHSKTKLPILQDQWEYETKQEDVFDENFGIEYTNCFLYEITPTGAVIYGLTEEGMKRDFLQIPAVIDGKRVYKIAKNAFQGDILLKEIQVGNGIAAVENDVFDGCIALKKVIFTQKNPNKCQIGEQLLDGTNAAIYVSSEVAQSYRIAYGWSLYANRIKERN